MLTFWCLQYFGAVVASVEEGVAIAVATVVAASAPAVASAALLAAIGTDVESAAAAADAAVGIAVAVVQDKLRCPHAQVLCGEKETQSDEVSVEHSLFTKAVGHGTRHAGGQEPSGERGLLSHICVMQPEVQGSSC